jgi:hypothetical protein
MGCVPCDTLWYWRLCQSFMHDPLIKSLEQRQWSHYELLLNGIPFPPVTVSSLKLLNRLWTVAWPMTLSPWLPWLCHKFVRMSYLVKSYTKLNAYLFHRLHNAGVLSCENNKLPIQTHCGAFHILCTLSKLHTQHCLPYMSAHAQTWTLTEVTVVFGSCWWSSRTSWLYHTET